MGVAAALLYLLFAQRPLVPTIRLESIQSITPENSTKAVGSVKGTQVDGKGASLEERGLYEKAGRSFSIRPDQQGVAEVDRSGRSLWSREFGSPITAASVSSSISAWGLLDGSIQVLDGEGRRLWELKPSAEGLDSAYPCIYSLAISAGGESIAALYGLSPQYFLVFERAGGSYSLSYGRKLEKQVRNAQASSFSMDGSCVIGRTGDGLAFYDVRRGKGELVHAERFSGEAELRIEPFGDCGFAVLLAKGGERFAGLVRYGTLAAMFPVAADSSDISIEENSLLVEGGGIVHSYKVAEP